VFGYGARPDVDLRRRSSIEKALADFRPDVVINPAAYTAVDRAESEPDQAFALNRDGARAAALAAAQQGVPVFHLSTDYVFDGKKQGAYIESDPVAPQGVYGRSKLEGELAVAEANPKHIVLRTSWVYSPFGSNFVRTHSSLGDPLSSELKVSGVTHLAGPETLTWHTSRKKSFVAPPSGRARCSS
jgi:dTDP-4-dehydrorhamnose reductase